MTALASFGGHCCFDLVTSFHLDPMPAVSVEAGCKWRAVGFHCQPNVEGHSSCKPWPDTLGMQLLLCEPFMPKQVSALQPEASGIHCPPGVFRSMPHYPNIDQQNDYIISRFDGCLIDGLAWSQAATLVATQPEVRESAMEEPSSSIGLGLTHAKQQSAAHQGRAVALQELNTKREVRKPCDLSAFRCVAASCWMRAYQCRPRWVS